MTDRQKPDPKANGTADREALAADLETVDSRLEGDIDCVEELQQRVEGSVHLGKKALEILDEIENQLGERLDELESTIEQQQNCIDELREEQRLFEAMGEALANDPDARVAHILQTLHNDAKENPNDRARMTAREAWTLVNRSIDRARMYDTLRRAESLVDDTNVCEFVEKPRGHDPPSHLRVDLSEGQLPARVGGRRIRSGGTGDE